MTSLNRDTKHQQEERPLVLVNWTDSVRDDNSWVFTKDEDWSDFPEKLEHESVGWLIKDTKDFISLAHSRSVFTYEDGDNSVIRSVTIPRCAITKITKL